MNSPPRITFCLPHELVIIADVIMDQPFLRSSFFFADAVEPRLSGLAIFTQNECQQLLPWTQECISSAHAQTPTCTAVYQLSVWVKAWFIHSIVRYIHPACLWKTRRPDNRGSTVTNFPCDRNIEI